MMNSKLKLAEFCSGTGAFSLAFEKTNKVETVFANDFDINSEKIFNENFSISLTRKDIHEIETKDIPSHDILTAGFPCFIAGTKVLTNNGYKNIEEVLIDDKLLTHTGNFQNILNIQTKHFEGIIYQIKIGVAHNIISCTEDHPFYVRKNNKISWIKASELDNDCYIGMVINTKNDIPIFIFDNQEIKLDKPELWFIMGIYLRYKHIENPNLLLFFQNIFPNNDIPEWIQDAPIKFIEEFLKGYGEIQQNYQFQRLYLKLGYYCGESFRFHNLAWFQFQNVEKKQVNETVYNFEVEYDNSYIVHNSIVHNCQPFSIAGKQDGFNDERSNVFWKLIQIIKYHKPRVVIFENVKNLTSHDDGNTFKVIEKEIKKLKYYYKYQILNTSEITEIPQNRERIYIICFKNKQECEAFEFPKKSNKVSKLIDLMEQNVNDKYYYKDDLKVWNEINTNITKHINTNTIYQYRRYYVRENKNGLCPTLTANMGSGGHNVPLIKDNKGIRKLTPRECFNLQGFPSSYKFPKISNSALYKLAGNAVSYPVVEKLSINILKALNLENQIEIEV